MLNKNSWKQLGILLSLLAGFMPLLAATEPKPVLMLVTGAKEMPSGKPTGLWLEEFAVPYAMLRDAGYPVEVVTPAGGAVPIDPRSQPDAAKQQKWQQAIQRLTDTEPLAAVKSDAFAAIFVPGGHGAMFDLADDPAVAKLIGQFYQQNKPIAAVCHGPAALVNVIDKNGTPLVSGKRLTAFSNAEEHAVALAEDMPFLLESRLRNLGADVVVSPLFTAHAVRDGNLITGQNPASSQQTAELLLELLSIRNEEHLSQ